MKRLFRYLLLGVLLVLLVSGIIGYFKLSDLRSGYNLPDDDPEKVKTLLAAMAKVHRTHMWDSLETYQVTYSEEFYGLIGKMGNPFAEAQTKFSLNYLADAFTGQLRIISGEDHGLTWGLQAGQAYTMGENGEFVKDDDAVIQFWLPTYQYFVEFARRIQEANAYQYMGDHEINGESVEGFLASWNTVEPQRDIDQYIVWISKASKRIVKVEYTIREMYPFLTGAAYFEDYQEFEGILLPTEFPVESNLVGEGLLHTMKILDFKGDVLKRGELTPL